LHEAVIRMIFEDEATAKSITFAIEPDNLQAPSTLDIKSKIAGKCLEVSITCRGKLETLIQTVDDLLSCVQVAEKSIKCIQ